jgi:tRNA pseudouridine38-40 synthase
MPTRAFRVAYDGAPFRGFQRQPDVPTVEDAILDALRALDVLDADVPPGYAAAGRTDAGVSALAQTVAFEAPDWLAPGALNAELPRSVRAWAHADAPEGFHATYDAGHRTYRYHLYARDADIDLARDGAARMEGSHDVHNLTPDDESTEREIAAVDVARADGAAGGGDGLVLTVRAPGFCRQQVRRMATVLYHVATAAYTPSYVEEVLSPAELTGPAGIPPAPPEPLVLADVAYPALSWTVDDDAAEVTREAFHDRVVEHHGRARVAADVYDGVGEARRHE